MKLYTVRLRPEQIEKVYNIITECGEDMRKRLGLTHWSPTYPLEEMRRYAESKEVYAVRDKDSDKTLATFTIDSQTLIPYNNNFWSDPSHEALYLSKLAVLPEYQGKGIGSWCMKEVERLAKLKGTPAIRFNALIRHNLLIKFYHCKLNYNICGVVEEEDIWQESKKWESLVFEKVI